MYQTCTLGGRAEDYLIQIRLVDRSHESQRFCKPPVTLRLTIASLGWWVSREVGDFKPHRYWLPTSGLANWILTRLYKKQLRHDYVLEPALGRPSPRHPSRLAGQRGPPLRKPGRPYGTRLFAELRRARQRVSFAEAAPSEVVTQTRLSLRRSGHVKSKRARPHTGPAALS